MKTMILLLVLTLAATQPLAAWEEDVSSEGANTAEEIRRLREDLQDGREQASLQRRIDEKSENNEWFASLSQKDQEMLTKNEPY